MNYIIISGSHRTKSQSEKVSRWLMVQLESTGESVDLLPLTANPYPLWDESAWDPESELSKQMKPIEDRVRSADGIIIVAPEWSGMVPGGLKNLLLFMGHEEMGHKPVLLVGVSAARGGAYPIAEMRISGYKNTKMVYIPDHLIIRNVGDVMNDHNPTIEDKADGYIRKRALYSLDVLKQYTAAMKPLRDNPEMFSEDYQYGM